MAKQKPKPADRPPEKKSNSGLYGDDFSGWDWDKVLPPDFLLYHEIIEKGIVDACKASQTKKGPKGVITDENFRKVWTALELSASKLVASILADRRKQNEDLNVAGIDTCWMAIFCCGLIAYCWSVAVARGKSIDRKRDNPGRKGWRNALESFPEMMRQLHEIGKEIGTLKVSREGDLDLSIQLKRLTADLVATYGK